MPLALIMWGCEIHSVIWGYISVKTLHEHFKGTEGVSDFEDYKK